MAKIVAFLSTACLICLLIAMVVYLRFYGGAHERKFLDSGAVVKEVRQLNYLVTVNYSVEKVVGLREDKSPLGSESILLLVRGKVQAGVDLTDLNPGDVTMLSPNTLRIHLMPPTIHEAFLDEKYTKVWDRQITWWTPWVSADNDLEHKARLQALGDIKKAALEMGILDEAKRNAELDISKILEAFGVAKVTFVYGS